MDPLEINNQIVNDLKAQIESIITDLDEHASLHDFRMVNGEHHINIIFDLVVPYNYTIEQEHKMVLEIIKQISAIDERYQCIITPEHSFLAAEE